MTSSFIIVAQSPTALFMTSFLVDFGGFQNRTFTCRTGIHLIAVLCNDIGGLSPLHRLNMIWWGWFRRIKWYALLAACKNVIQQNSENIIWSYQNYSTFSFVFPFYPNDVTTVWVRCHHLKFRVTISICITILIYKTGLEWWMVDVPFIVITCVNKFMTF